MKPLAWPQLSAESFRYLHAPAQSFGWAGVFVLVATYGILTNPNPYPYSTFVMLLMGAAIVTVLTARPRWAVYGLVLAALVVYLFAFVHRVANGEQDALSTRDAAVEVTAQALLRGENAWNASPGVGVTTGPTSILLALPFVAVFGQINWLTFGFWLAFFGVLLAWDIQYRNGTWPMLALLFITGLMDFEHTLYWSLDELYYPLLSLAAAYLCARRDQWGPTGALLAAALLSRPSYAFLLVGFGLWVLFAFPFQWKRLAWLAAGFGVGSGLILLPFVVIGGKDLWVNNPWTFAFEFSGAAWLDSNFIFRALNQLNIQVGPGLMRWVKLGLTLAPLVGLAWALRRRGVTHPFWHIAVGAFLAHTLFWLPGQWPKDYSLIFVLPAMFAIALSRTDT